MPEFIGLFKGLSAIKGNIKKSIEEDLFIGHYITYLNTPDDLFEITVYGTSGQNPSMVWASKVVVPYGTLVRVMKIMYGMINMYEKRASISVN